jgi:hypothetical protein
MKALSGALLVLGLAAFPLAACGGNPSQSREDRMEEYARAHGVDADVELDENGEVRSVTVNQGAGQVGTNLDLPADFPDDIPVYPGLSLHSVAPVPGGGLSVSGRTEDEMAEVAAFYAREMAASGWTDNSPAQAVATQRTLRFTKGARNAMLNLVPTDPGTTVSLNLMDLG